MSDHRFVMPERTESITPFLVMDILERAKEMETEGVDIVHLEVGEPDFDSPVFVRDAAKKAIDDGRTRYAPSLGLPQLRAAIAETYKSRYGINISPERVILTSGSSPALQMVFASLLNPGDEVIMTDPHYACYANFVRFFGGVPIFVRTCEADNFRFSPSNIESKISEKTRAVLINSPENPTGAVMSSEDLDAISRLGVTIVSDEIYEGLVYDGADHSILEYSENAFVVNGFSKRYAMTGWRLGYLIVPEEFILPVRKLVQNFFISAPTLSQWAGLAAIEGPGDDLAAMRDEFKKRRDFLLGGLEKIGLKVGSRPEGAFYVLVNVEKYTTDSLSFCNDLLEKALVAATPGVDFGDGGEGFIRLSYATSMERLEEGLKRIDRYLKSLVHS
ncbi:MAG: pyridoxal phosphate-dependent aminotransferase [bacterium]|nr:pyridoxal phosphate-dependent aminotransferase [bacterium]